MYYNDDNFIPGLESASWVFGEGEDDGINASISINTDEEAEQADNEALTQTAENEAEGNAIANADQMLNIMMINGFRGYETLARWDSYLSRGGNPAVINMLFDTREYLPDSAFYSTEDMKESVSQTGGGFKNFIMKIWNAIVTIFQRLIPWFGQNINTLATRIEAYSTKAAGLDKDMGNSRLKAYTKDKKVVSPGAVNVDGWVKNLGHFFAGLFKEKNSSPVMKMHTKIERNTNVKDYTVDKIKSLVADTKKGIMSLKQYKTDLDNLMNEAKKKLNSLHTVDAKKVEEERKEANDIKQRATTGIANLRHVCQQFTQVLNDIKFLIGVASS